VDRHNQTSPTFRFQKATKLGQSLSQVQPSQEVDNVALSRSAATVRLNSDFHYWSKECSVELAFGGSSDGDTMLRDIATVLGLLGVVIYNDAAMRDRGETVVRNHAEAWSMQSDPARK
jgi:hypothetical protein